MCWLFASFASAQTEIFSGHEAIYTISAPFEQDVYTFHASSGDTFMITVGKILPTTGSTFSPTYRVLAPGGAVLNGSYGVFTATAPGTYTILAEEDYGYGATGSYRLHFFSIPGPIATADEGGEMINGGNHDGVIGNSADVDAWTFHGNAGDTIILSIGIRDIEKQGPFDPGFKIYRPDGTRHVSASGTFTAPTTGTYTLLVNDYFGSHVGTSTGGYRLHFIRVPGQVTVADDGGSLTSGGNHDGSIGTPADLDPWTFHANAGDTYYLSLAILHSDRPGFFSPSFEIYGPDGSLVRGSSDRTAETTGTYTVVVKDYNGSWTGPDTGRYRLHYIRIPGPQVVGDDGGTLTNGGYHHATLGVPGDLDTWTFHATAGDIFHLSLEIVSTNAGSSFDPTYRVFLPNGTWLRGSGSSGFTAPVTGTYTVVTHDRDGSWIGTHLGTYRLRLYIPLPPVLFIPGIAGSELTGGSYQGGGSFLWPTLRPDKMEELHLTKGKSDVRAVGVLKYFTLAGDIGVPKDPIPFYGPFLEHLQARGYQEYSLDGDPSRLISNHLNQTAWTEKPTLFTFPYDWRQDNASHAGTLHSYISRIRQLHNQAKVRVITHSMGGLVLRRYMIDHGTDALHSVINVAPPVWGTPQAIYRMHTGLFFGPDELGVIDWITRDEMKEALWSFPAVAQLLPSTYYMLHGGALLFSEAGWDYNSNGDAHEIYDPLQYFTVMRNEAIRQKSHFDPITVNQTFHTVRQDDWSDIPSSIPMLLIAGHSKRGIFETTPISVVAHGSAWWTSLNPGGIGANIIDSRRIDPIYGPGDGTVPLLSVQRTPGLRSSNTVSVTCDDGNNNGHMQLLGENTEVWTMIDDFLINDVLQSSSSPPSRKALKTSPSEKVTIVIKGQDYVKVRNGEGDENTRYTDIAAARVPGIDITYPRKSVIIQFTEDQTVTIDPPGGANPITIEVEIFRHNKAGELTERKLFRTGDGGWNWRIQSYSDEGPSLFMDWNSDGTYGPDEKAVPAFSGSGSDQDASPPIITFEISRTDEGVIVNLFGTDHGPNPPQILHSLNGGPTTTYSEPISIPDGKAFKIIAFALDSAGNTSGVIQTDVQPSIATEIVNPGKLRLSWPASDAYDLEESTNLNGNWKPITVPVNRLGDRHSVDIPISEPQAFQRLRSKRITR